MTKRRVGLLVGLALVIMIWSVPAYAQGPYCEPAGPPGTYGAICVQNGVYCIISDDLKLCVEETPSYKHLLCQEGETEAVTVRYHVESRTGALMDRADITLAAGLKSEDLDSLCPPWIPGCVPTLIPKSYDMVNAHGGVWTPQAQGTTDTIRYNFTPSGVIDFEYDILAIANGPSLNFYAEPTVFSDNHKVTTVIGGLFVSLDFPVYDQNVRPGPWLGEYEYAGKYCEAEFVVYLPVIM